MKAGLGWNGILNIAADIPDVFFIGGYPHKMEENLNNFFGVNTKMW